MNKKTILQALRRMGELAQEAGLELELSLYGGALMMLAYDARAMTKDVDAVIRPTEEGKKLAAQVAIELGLPENWTNDDVKMFLAPDGPTRTLPLEMPGLQLTAPTAHYLLAMKALACRTPLPGYQGDLDDLRFLIKKLSIDSVDLIQDIIDKYYPDDVIPKEHELVLEAILAETSK